MLTHEIISLPELGMVQVRIIEDDGMTCLTEPCYPASLHSGQEEWEAFATELERRIQDGRDAPPPEPMPPLE